MSASALRLLDPQADDELVATSGIVAMRCSPGGPAALANAQGRTVSWGTQQRDGNRTSAFFRSLELVRDLSRSTGTTPYPLLTAMRIEALEQKMANADEGQLTARWSELERLEVAATARRDAALDHRDRAAHRQALLDHAAILEEMVAIDFLLIRKPGRPDPRRCT